MQEQVLRKPADQVIWDALSHSKRAAMEARPDARGWQREIADQRATGRKQRIGAQARALDCHAGEQQRLARIEAQLWIEAEARLEQLRAALELQHVHDDIVQFTGMREPRWRIRLAVLLAAEQVEQTERFLHQYKATRATRRAALTLGRLRTLEQHVDALALAATQLAGPQS